MADQAVENENIQAAADVASVEGEAGTAAGKRVADDNAEAPAAKKAKADSEAGAGEAGEEETVKVEETFEDAEAEAENEGSRDGEEVLKEPVRLGPKDFYSPTVTYNYFRDLVKFWARDVDFNEYEHMVLLDLLKKGHSDPDAKIGPGVKAFQVRQHPEFGNPCFFIVRTDGTAEDFSYRKCMDKLLPPIPEAALSHRSEKENGGGGRGGGGRGGHRGGGRGGFRGGRGGGGGGGGRGRGRGRGRGGRGRW